MAYFKLTTSRTVPEPITGDYYKDWKKTLGDKPNTVDAIAHKIVMAIETKKSLLAYLDEEDSFEGELFEFLLSELKNYVAASVFTILSEKSIEAFYNLDVLGDETAFNDKISEMQSLVQEMLQKLAKENVSVTFNATADSATRILTLELIAELIELIYGWGYAKWGEFGWGESYWSYMKWSTDEWG